MNLMRPAVAFFSVFVFAGGASAATVTVYGNNVSFTYDDATDYGVGIVVGDAILFTPTGIIAESEDGAGLVTTTKMLNLQIQVTTQGYWLQDFNLIEQGDYQLSGAGASADMDGIFKITSNTSSYTVQDNFDAGPLTVQNSLTEWTAGSMISLADTAGWGSDTDVDIDLTNELSASTAADGEYAMVQKKLGAVSIEITAVPVPAAVWLFGSGLGVLGWMRRRRAA